jgi:hypothetical protein
MRAWLILALLLPATAGAVESSVPAYLPRGASAIVLLRGVTTPQVRLAWRLPFVFEKRGTLSLGLEGGVGYGIPSGAGLSQTDRVTFYYQHPVQLSLGYFHRYDSGMRAGLELLSGPVFYGARFTSSPRENRMEPVIEGRAMLGFGFEHLSFGISLGYMEVYKQSTRSRALPFLGGVSLGTFVRW